MKVEEEAPPGLRMGSRVNLRVGYLLGAVLVPSPSFIESGVCVAKGDPLGVVGGLGSGGHLEEGLFLLMLRTPLIPWHQGSTGSLGVSENTHLEYFANNVVDADTQLVVTGYADKNTGSTRRNQLLSEQRVKTVVDLLTKAGASVDNIETAAYGSSVQLFDGSAKNRVVTIELK